MIIAVFFDQYINAIDQDNYNVDIEYTEKEKLIAIYTRQKVYMKAWQCHEHQSHKNATPVAFNVFVFFNPLRHATNQEQFARFALLFFIIQFIVYFYLIAVAIPFVFGGFIRLPFQPSVVLFEIVYMIRFVFFRIFISHFGFFLITTFDV